MNVIRLKPFETVKMRQARDRLAIDADRVQDAIKSQPGIPSKAAISKATGLTVERVAEVIRRINAEQVGGLRLDYGEAKATGGPQAGQIVRGWFAMNRKAHHVAMVHADEHSLVTELGVRRSRLVRYAQAQGIRHAEATVDAIASQLGMSYEAMTQGCIQAFEELLDEAAETEVT